MYALTLDGKPATLAQLYKAEGDTNGAYRIPSPEAAMVVCAKTMLQAKQIYIYHFGYTWAERAKGVEVAKAKLS